MRLPLILFLTLAAVLPARAEQVWLVVGASDPTPAGIARKAKGFSGGLIVRTGDCAGKNRGFAWVAAAEPTADSAKATLLTVRKTIPDAYLKRCEVRPGTLLAYRIPAVDSSIAEVPETAVNWDDRDRVSAIRALPGGRALVIARYFERGADDPLEGRRERVILVDRNQRQQELEKNCIDPAGVAAMGEFLAFQCAREQAGDHLMHSVVVFDGDGAKVKEIGRCRNPLLKKPRYLYCDGESVAPDGTLTLVRKRHVLK